MTPAEREAARLPVRLQGWRGWRRASLPEEDLERCLRGLPRAPTLKETAAASVLLVTVDPPLVVKRYAVRGLRDALRSRARRASRNAGRLRRAGIDVAPTLFVLSGARADLLGVEWVEGARTLSAVLYGGLERGARAALVERLADAVARAHAAGLRLRDLRAENVLVRDGRCVFVDFDGVRRRSGVRGDARDLARLSASFPPGGPVSSTDRARFLRAYLDRRRALGSPCRRPRRLARFAARRTRALWTQWRGTGLRLDASGIHPPAPCPERG